MKNFFKQVLVALLTFEAKGVVHKYRPKVVAITGSVGKTSTKDAIYTMLEPRARVRRSEKSFNSEVGLPLTILGMPNAWSNPLRWAQNLLDGLFLLIFKAHYPEWLVLEVGADRPGDVRSVAAWLPVSVVVITRLPEMPVHVEYFASPQELVEEKASLIGALKDGGTLVLYGDEENTAALRERARGKTVITFGLSPQTDVRAEEVKIHFNEGGEPDGARGTLVWDGSSAEVIVGGAIGEHALLPLLAAAAVGKALGCSVDEVAKALGSYRPPPGRTRLIKGIKKTTIIDDTYNSSPAAVTAALETLASLPHGRKVAVLGDMLELGRHSAQAHRDAGALAAKTCDLLLTVGFRARDIAQGALDNGMPDAAILQYEDARRAGKELETLLAEGDVVLVKGSQSMRMERAVEEIMAEPERAAELLVRQDPEWKKR